MLTFYEILALFKNMKSLIYKDGNLLFAKDVQVIGHQANCQNTFGSGIARTIREMYPDAYKADCAATLSKTNTLGNFSVGYIPFTSGANKHDNQIALIYNLYGQNLFGKGTRQTNYDALYSALEGMANELTENGMDLPAPSVGFPYKMGSDRGGGDFRIVERLIEVAFTDYPSDVIIYRLDAN
jgi:O-acetyl-ADP-ribose deacetylase (regulator of RNase III)